MDTGVNGGPWENGREKARQNGAAVRLQASLRESPHSLSLDTGVPMCDPPSGETEDMVRDAMILSLILFEQSPCPMWLFDLSTLRFLAANRAALAACGYTRAEFLSMTLREFHSRTELARLENLLHRIEEGCVSAGRWRLMTGDGSSIEGEMTLHSVVSRERRLCLALMQNIRKAGPPQHARGEFAPLGSREAQVVRLLAEGLRSKDIARTMGISIRTVETHRKTIHHKLGLHSTAELIRLAIRTGIVPA